MVAIIYEFNWRQYVSATTYMKLKEERDDFMLKYAKALCDKIVQTNELCTERNKLGEENKRLRSERDKWRGKYNRLKSEFNLLKNKIWTTSIEIRNIWQKKNG